MNNPFFHALGATAYIVGISAFLFYVPERTFGPEDTVFAPIMMLSLLVLSVAVMGFLFWYEPIRLFAEGQKSAALHFLGKTIVWFAALTAVVVLLALFVNSR